MKRFLLYCILAVLAAPLPLLAADGPKRIENFALDDVNGAKHALTDYTKQKAIVLIFIATQCPVSNAYNARMEALHSDYSDRGVVFLGINSNKAESIDEIRDHAKEHGLAFAILKDPENRIADRLQASVTPEVYVLSPQLELLYQGRIDDNSRGTSVTSQDLRRTLDEILAGKPVSVSRTKAFGCTIKRVSH